MRFEDGSARVAGWRVLTLTFQLSERRGGGLGGRKALDGGERLGGRLCSSLLGLCLGLIDVCEQGLGGILGLGGGGGGGGAAAKLGDLLVNGLQCLDEVFQGGGIVGVKQQTDAIEQADTLRVDAQLLEGLIELRQFLLRIGCCPD